jgi:paraquat-inducible protein B
MMPEWLKDWWPAFLAALTLVVAPSLRWAFRKGLATQDDLTAAIKTEQEARQRAVDAAAEAHAKAAAEAQARAAVVEARLIEMEAEIRHLPTADDVAEIKEQLSGIKAQQAATQAMLQGLTRLIENLDNTVRTHQSLFTEAARR